MDSSSNQNNWLPPGSLVYIGENFQTVKINIIDYSETFYSEIEVQNIEQCKDNTDEQETVTWVDITGLNDTKVIEEIGKFFGIHKMWLEDVLNTHHLPKAEEVDDLLFMIMKAVGFDEHLKSIEYEQVSLFLGKNFVISFHENPVDILEPVKARIRQGKGRIRGSKADYLFYALVDSMVGNYVKAANLMESKIEDLEEKSHIEISDNLPHDIRHLKYEMMYFRKAAIPLRDSLAVINRSEHEDIEPRTKMYLRDVSEHAIAVVSQLDSCKELLTSLTESYNQSLNRRLNDILRVLTIFTSIFSPLTFIVGIYGMNFDTIPEFKWEHGYLFVWILMLSIITGMVIVFRKKRWL